MLTFSSNFPIKGFCFVLSLVQISLILFVITLIQLTHSWHKTSTHRAVKSKEEVHRSHRIQTRLRRSSKIFSWQETRHLSWNIKRRPIFIPFVKCSPKCVKEYSPIDIKKQVNYIWVERTIRIPVSCRLPVKCPKVMISDFNADRIPKLIIKAKCQNQGRELIKTRLVKYKKPNGYYKVRFEDVPIDCLCKTCR